MKGELIFVFFYGLVIVWLGAYPIWQLKREKLVGQKAEREQKEVSGK